MKKVSLIGIGLMALFLVSVTTAEAGKGKGKARREKARASLVSETAVPVDLGTADLGTTGFGTTGLGTIPSWTTIAHWDFEEGSGQTVSDDSGNGWNGYLGGTTNVDTNDPAWTADAYAGSFALDFTPDGVYRDMVQIPGQDGAHVGSNLPGLMIDLWIKPEAFTNTWSYLAYGADFGPVGNDRYTLCVKSDGMLKLSAAGTTLLTGANAITIGSWQRVTAVYDDALDYQELFIDGVSVVSMTNTNSLGPPNGQQLLSVGFAYGNQDTGFDGIIDDVTISAVIPTTYSILGTVTITPAVADGPRTVKFTVKDTVTGDAVHRRWLTLNFVSSVANYTLAQVPPGTWDVVAKEPGETLSDQVDDVDVTVGNATGINFTLPLTGPRTIPTTYDLKAWWEFEEGTGQASVDSSVYDWDGVLGNTTAAGEDADPVWTNVSYIGANSLFFDGNAGGIGTGDQAGANWGTSFRVDRDVIEAKATAGYNHPGDGAGGLVVDAYVYAETLGSTTGTVANPTDGRGLIYQAWSESYPDSQVQLFVYGEPWGSTNGVKTEGGVYWNVAGEALYASNTITPGQWYRITGVFQPEQTDPTLNLLQVYVDGNLEASMTTTNKIGTRGDSQATHVGRGWWQAGFHGIIDEVKVSADNRNVSGTITVSPSIVDGDAQVAFQVRDTGTLDVIYKRTLTLAFSGNSVSYTLPQVPPGTWDVAAKLQNSLADQVNIDVTLADANNVDFTLYGGDAYGDIYKPMGDNAVNFDDYMKLAGTYGGEPFITPASYWSMDEGTGTTVGNSLGALNGTLFGDTTWTNGSVNTGLYFDGTGDYVEVSDYVALDFNEELTIEAWIYPVSPVPAKAMIVAKYHRDSASRWHGYGLRLKNGKLQAWLTLNNGADYEAETYSTLIATDTWTRVKMTFVSGSPNGTVELYVTDMNTSVYTGSTVAGSLDQSTGPFRIGATHQWDGSPKDFWIGMIDEVKVNGRIVTGAGTGADFDNDNDVDFDDYMGLAGGYGMTAPGSWYFPPLP